MIYNILDIFTRIDATYYQREYLQLMEEAEIQDAQIRSLQELNEKKANEISILKRSVF